MILQFLLISIAIFVSVNCISTFIYATLFLTGMWLYPNPLLYLGACIAYLFSQPGYNVLMFLPIGISDCMNIGPCYMLCAGVGALLYFWIGTMIYVTILFIKSHVHIQIS